MIPGLSKKLEDATRHHYGADEDPLKFPPTVTDPEDAHEIALGVNRSLDRITDERLDGAVARGMDRAKFSKTMEANPVEIRDEAIGHAVTLAVVNAEIMHEQLAPGDFNEDAHKAGPNY